MKTLIWFREGLSGHYFKSLVDDQPTVVSFRIDPWWPGLYDAPPVVDPTINCVCLHPIPNFDTSAFQTVVTILAHDKIYHAAYNVFYKKLLVEHQLTEEHKNWQLNPVAWYDRAYYNIQEYVGLFQQDTVNNTMLNVINFDHILQEEYIESVFKQYFNRAMSVNMRSIVARYREQQLGIELPLAGTEMSDIVSTIPDQYFAQAPWFAAYCIYKYEHNNKLAETDRLWSIDSIERPIDKEFLLQIATQYNS